MTRQALQLTRAVQTIEILEHQVTSFGFLGIGVSLS